MLNDVKGGDIFSGLSSSVTCKTSDYIMKLVQEYAKYPFQLGEFDEDK